MIGLIPILARCIKSGAFLFLFLLFLHLNLSIYGQEYGLRFSGAEVPQYQRTTLDLNPDRFFSFRDEFTLTFDISFPPDLHRYYGYIIRIVDNKDKNIDLVFQYRDYLSTGLTVIHKNEQTNIFLETNLAELFEDWETIALAFDLNNHFLTLTFGDTSIVAKDIVLNNRVKILFGSNDYKHLKTNDVPPMLIKDIKLTQGNRLLHHWPLHESNGYFANDLVKQQKAQINNPTWIRHKFQNWENIYNDSIEGPAAVTYNPRDENIYLIGQNMMTIYNPFTKANETLKYNNIPESIIKGRQAFFDTVNDRLILFNIWNTNFASFDFNTLKWNNIYTGPRNPTLYWHYNKHFLEKDNSLLIFGGYGQYEFRNIVRKISLSDNDYDTLQTHGDTYHPRYLAALGAVEDRILLLGGRGSVSGKQIESPGNFYDFTEFSLKNNQFTRIYDFVPPIEDVAFANSLILDESNKSFYALAFPNYEFYSHLQLMRGNLDEPDFELLGDKIPYRFEDILSFADLYYCKSLNKLIAVTLFYNNDSDKTDFSVYTIKFPPEKFIENTDKTLSWLLSKWAIIVFVIAAIVLLFFIIKFIKHKRGLPLNEESKEFEKTNGAPEEILKRETPIIDNSTIAEEVTSYSNTVLFFGGFKVFNKYSEDITSKFSPLLKEIFILVWLNSLKGYNGVSSEKLKELFWFHKDEKKAMNNRAVNIAKLKCLLGEIDSCNLSRETGYWKIEFDENIVYNDYSACLKLANNKKRLQKKDITKLIVLTSKGAFLEDLSYEWLDAFKADISNIIIDTLVEFGLSYDVKQDPEFILNLANTIFYFDIVSEEAMILKCKALIAVGKHSLAKKCYTEFVKNYNALYDSEFDEQFSEIIK